MTFLVCLVMFFARNKNKISLNEIINISNKTKRIQSCGKTKFGCCANSYKSKNDKEGTNCNINEINKCGKSEFGCCTNSTLIRDDDKGSNCPKS